MWFSLNSPSILSHHNSGFVQIVLNFFLNFIGVHRVHGCCDIGLHHFGRPVEEAPFCHEERASLPQRSISKRSAIGIGGSSFGGGHPSSSGLEIDAVAPTHVAAPSTTGHDCQGQVALEVPIIC